MKRWLTRLRQTLLSSDVDKDDEFDARVYGDDQFQGRSDNVYVNYGNILMNLLSPGTFVDVGCANGFLPHHLRGLGVDAWGIEGAEAAFRHMPDSIKPFVCRLDLRERWGPLPFPVQRFDVVNFTEVAEHLKQEHEQQLLENVLGLVENFL
ncbi:MAG: methyltransferase domain-containing protein, partial [Pseudomonadales bacterium]|nr:methyltransferase domain-containing protein [Pseudomonadales bacterium]